MSNYTWILMISIIILLAIIGSYADKTNFGQGKNNNLEENENQLNQQIKEGKRLSDIKNDIELPNSDDKNNSANEEIESKKDNLNIEEAENFINEEQKAKNVDSVKEEKSFNEFDKKFKEILPEKELISDDLLNDIDNLTFDKTKKFETLDIPDLDDIELPKIKNSNDNWKF